MGIRRGTASRLGFAVQLCMLRHPSRPLAPRPGGPVGGARLVDLEYERGSTANVPMSFEPLTGRRRVGVAHERRKQEFGEQVGHIAEEDHPQAEQVRLVMDNLSAHMKAAFYESFPAEVARG